MAISGICHTVVQTRNSLDEVELAQGWNARNFYHDNDPANGWLTHTWAFFVNADGQIVEQTESGSFAP